ncbi:MAG: TRZ/ATZ family hydrolase [Candidatus Nanopelagicales bacterium]|jgi:5-methylthioadenosine/S-adenosylhomocysteine deaminase|nr:TRZ/ATZ family hydrolase [Candidatus Nanopelagicales bacterium]
MLEVIEARWVLPIHPWSVIEDGAVAIDAGSIVAVGGRSELQQRFPDAARTRLREHALLPGLVNGHTHAAMTLLRGYADDVPLMTWLHERIWPTEGRWVDEQFVRDGTRLAVAEMLQSGVTAFADMYFFPVAALEACQRAGIRILSGQVVVDGHTNYADGADDHIAKAISVIEQFAGTPLVHLSLAPHAPYTVSDDVFVRLVELCEERDLPLHTHLHETVAEVEESISQYGVRPVARLDRLGVISPRFMAAHAVHLNDEEIALMAQKGASLVHCPTSNLKLASGIARPSEWLRHGIPTGVGTDGVASNNRLDLLSDMRLASLLAKGSTGDASVMTARQVLHMATLGGAQALGLDDEIGSLEPGKSADMVALDVSDHRVLPVYDIASHLVNCLGRDDVTDVWVAGQPRVVAGELTADDPEELRALARGWQERINSA